MQLAVFSRSLPQYVQISFIGKDASSSLLACFYQDSAFAQPRDYRRGRIEGHPQCLCRLSYIGVYRRSDSLRWSERRGIFSPFPACLRKPRFFMQLSQAIDRRNGIRRRLVQSLQEEATPPRMSTCTNVIFAAIVHTLCPKTGHEILKIGHGNLCVDSEHQPSKVVTFP